MKTKDVREIPEKTIRHYRIRVDAHVDGGTGWTTEQQVAWGRDMVAELLRMKFAHRSRAAFDGDKTVILELCANAVPPVWWSAERQASYEAAAAEVCDAEEAIRETLRAAFGIMSSYLTVRRYHGTPPDDLAWETLT